MIKEQIVMDKEQYNYWLDKTNEAEKILLSFDKAVDKKIKEILSSRVKEERAELKKKISENGWMTGFKFGVVYLGIMVIYQIIILLTKG